MQTRRRTRHTRRRERCRCAPPPDLRALDVDALRRELAAVEALRPSARGHYRRFLDGRIAALRAALAECEGAALS